jgi:dihydrofolate reductase
VTRFHCHVAVSLDGMIARADGSFDWLEGFPAEEFGLEPFLAGVDAILMGRATYDAVRGMGGDWPHPGKPCFVVTSRPLPDAPAEAEARPGDLAAVVAEMEARGFGLVWAEGGGQLIRGLLALGRLDVLEMALIPVALGQGIPLFPPGTPETRLRLRQADPKPGGALHLVYDIARWT